MLESNSFITDFDEIDNIDEGKIDETFASVSLDNVLESLESINAKFTSQQNIWNICGLCKYDDTQV